MEKRGVLKGVCVGIRGGGTSREVKCQRWRRWWHTHVYVIIRVTSNSLRES